LPAAVHALALVPVGGEMRILGTSLALRGGSPPHELRFTTDGTEPGAASPRYRRPVPASPALRAAMVVQGRVAVTLAASAPKYRIPANAPPDTREQFHR
jgi:hypothetical protein